MEEEFKNEGKLLNKAKNIAKDVARKIKKTVKIVIMPMLVFIKTLIIPISMILAVFALANFNVVVTDASAYDEYDSMQMNGFNGDFIVKTDEPNAAPALTKEQLEVGLPIWLSSNSKMLSNAQSVLDTVVQCQENYQVNAVFTYGMSRAEQSIGDSEGTCHDNNNWMSWKPYDHYYATPNECIDHVCEKIKNGNIYFSQGLFTVKEIYETYEGTSNWINKAEEIIRYMKELYAACGVTISEGNSSEEVLDEENQTKMDQMLEEAQRIANDDTYKYVYTGSHGWKKGDPTPKSFDCSGFVRYLYLKYFNINVGESSSDINKKYKGTDYEVSFDNLQPGDILWRSGHVEIYCGNGKRVGAHNEEKGISVEDYSPPGNFKRVFRPVRGTVVNNGNNGGGNGGGTVAKGGAGTIGVYKSSTGKSFNLYLQGGNSPWAHNSYSSGTMASSGCGPTAVAIIASGYNGKITPENFRKDLNNTYGAGTNHSNEDKLKASFGRILPNVKTSKKDFTKANIKSFMQKGGQIALCVGYCKFTSNRHYIALIDYRSSDQNVYVAHGTAKRRPWEWQPIDYIVKHGVHSEMLCVGGN